MRGGFGELERLSWTEQIMHVKKPPKTRKVTTDKIRGLLCGTHTGPGRAPVSPTPKPEWKTS